MKTATVVEFDLKEVRDLLLKAAKEHARVEGPGGSMARFIYDGQKLNGAIVRFGADVSGGLVDAELGKTEPPNSH